MVKISMKLLRDQANEALGSPLFHILVWLIVFDILSGYIKAFKTKNLDSKVSTNGWLKHALVLMMVSVLGVYSRALGRVAISQFICIGFIGSYGLSLLENLDAIGIPYPETVREFFKQMKENDEIKIKNNGDISLDVKDSDEINIKID